MKNFVLRITVVLIVFTLITSCKDYTTQSREKAGYIISGTVKGLDQGFVKMTDYGNREKITVIDSTQIVNGAFEFTGKVDFPDMVNLSIDGKISRFFLENSHITLDIDWSEVQASNWQFNSKVSGSKSHDLYAAIEAQTKAILEDPKYKTLDKVGELYAQAKKTKSAEDLEKASEWIGT